MQWLNQGVRARKERGDTLHKFLMPISFRPEPKKHDPNKGVSAYPIYSVAARPCAPLRSTLQFIL